MSEVEELRWQVDQLTDRALEVLAEMARLHRKRAQAVHALSAVVELLEAA